MSNPTTTDGVHSSFAQPPTATTRMPRRPRAPWEAKLRQERNAGLLAEIPLLSEDPPHPQEGAVWLLNYYFASPGIDDPGAILFSVWAFGRLWRVSVTVYEPITNNPRSNQDAYQRQVTITAGQAAVGATRVGRVWGGEDRWDRHMCVGAAPRIPVVSHDTNSWEGPKRRPAPEDGTIEMVSFDQPALEAWGALRVWLDGVEHHANAQPTDNDVNPAGPDHIPGTAPRSPGRAGRRSGDAAERADRQIEQRPANRLLVLAGLPRCPSRGAIWVGPNPSDPDEWAIYIVLGHPRREIRGFNESYDAWLATIPLAT